MLSTRLLVPVMAALTSCATAGSTLGTPAGSPLGVVWRQSARCPDSHLEELVETGSTLAWIVDDQLVRFDRATGASAPTIRLRDRARLVEAVGDVAVLWVEERALRGLDLTNGVVRWTHAGAHGSNFPIAATGDASFVFVSNRGAGEAERHDLEVLDPRSGHARWVRQFPATDRPRWITVGAGLVYVTVEHEAGGPASSGGFNLLHAFALADGRPMWTYQYPRPKFWSGEPLGVLASTGDLVLRLDAAVIVIDPKGSPTSIALAGATGVIAHDRRAYVLLYDQESSVNRVAAIDVPSRKVVWIAPFAASRLVSATAHTLYITSDDEQLLELDAGTGKRRATFGVSGADVRRLAGAPAFLLCDPRRRLSSLLGPTPRDTPTETATVTGTLSCKDCDPGMQIELRIGDSKLTTAASGPFSITVTGRGSLSLFTLIWPQQVRLATVNLTGNRRYELGPVTFALPNRQE
ncbi:MAG: PQQ-binding-like beta-propeller repeat protein [Deltaproteobacteria bacterium]|nr:PQQ-binding-like beta-propeller repeat protein [Deltaproteobacteria bacterium]